MNVSIARVTLTDYAQTHLDHSSVLVRSDLPEMVSSVEVGWYDILLTLCIILAQRILHYYNDSCVADSYKALYCSRYCSPCNPILCFIHYYMFYRHAILQRTCYSPVADLLHGLSINVISGYVILPPPTLRQVLRIHLTVSDVHIFIILPFEYFTWCILHGIFSMYCKHWKVANYLHDGIRLFCYLLLASFLYFIYSSCWECAVCT
jgi:hypothetical protein